MAHMCVCCFITLIRTAYGFIRGGAAINVLFMTDRASAAVAKQTFRSALININVHVVGSVSDHPTQGPARGTTRGD